MSIVTNNNMVNIKCGMSEFNIMGTDPEEFPDLPLVEYEHTITLKRSALKSMISQTLFAVSTNESRPIHTGSLFEMGGGQGAHRGQRGRIPAGPAPGECGKDHRKAQFLLRGPPPPP